MQNLTLGGKCGKEIVVGEIELDSPLSEVRRGTISFAKDSLVQEHFSGQVGTCPCIGHYENPEEGSIWVLDHILEFCEKMGLAVEGQETNMCLSSGCFRGNQEESRNVGR